MSNDERIYPIPEAVRPKDYRIEEGRGSVNNEAGVMRVPLEGTPTARRIRAHEMSHAKLSPGKPEAPEGIEMRAIQSAEDMRVNLHCNQQGLHEAMSAPIYDTDKFEEWAASTDRLEAFRVGVSMVGTGDFEPVIEGFGRHDPALAAEVKAFAEAAYGQLWDEGKVPTFEDTLRVAQALQDQAENPPQQDEQQGEPGEGDESGESGESGEDEQSGASGGSGGDDDEQSGEDGSGGGGGDEAGDDEGQGEGGGDGESGDGDGDGESGGGESGDGESDGDGSQGGSGKSGDSDQTGGSSTSGGGGDKRRGAEREPVLPDKPDDKSMRRRIDPAELQDDTSLPPKAEPPPEPAKAEREAAAESDQPGVEEGLERLKGFLHDGYADGAEVALVPMKESKVPLSLRLRRLMRGVTGKATPDGRVVRHINRFATDKAIFHTRGKDIGGATVLIDTSGSMSLSETDVEQIMELAPASTIAVYSGDFRASVGYLRIVADHGRRARRDDLSTPGFGNLVDVPALEWLGRKPGPRLWVCDGIVTGAGDRMGRNIVRACMDLCRRHHIVRVDGVHELEQWLENHRRARRGRPVRGREKAGR